MAFTLMLNLPRDGGHVSMLRDVVGVALHGQDVPAEAVDDVQLALAEAAANVIRHAAGSDVYSVQVVIGDGSCEISVVDGGPGLELEDEEAPGDHILAEGGRGLGIMRALTDELSFVQDGDTSVRFVKTW